MKKVAGARVSGLVLVLILLGSVVDASAQSIIGVFGKNNTEAEAFEKRIESKLVAIGVDSTRAKDLVRRVTLAGLSANDLSRLGINESSLPCLALVKLGPDGRRAEKVMGSPPVVYRQIYSNPWAEDLVVARWARLSGQSLPEHWQELLLAFRPNQLLVLVAANSVREAEALEQAATSLRNFNKISSSELPVLAVTYTPEMQTHFARLGLGSDSLPCMALVRTSEYGNLSSIAGGVLYRNVNSYDFQELSGQVLNGWLRVRR